MREDIEIAFGLLDPDGRSAITGVRASGTIKKAFQGLADFLSDETVLAVAAGFDPGPGFAEQRGMGAGSALSAVVSAARSGRLLALTELNLWEVHSGGMLNGNRPEGIRYQLADIIDIRTLTKRSLGRRLGAKESYLTFDYLRGAQIESRVNLLPSAASLAIFAADFREQVDAVDEEIRGVVDPDGRDESTEPADEPAVSSHAPTQPPSFVADELLKLAQLRDAGVITDDEFSRQKSKLLA